jgi:hypothetical protein
MPGNDKTPTTYVGTEQCPSFVLKVNCLIRHVPHPEILLLEGVGLLTCGLVDLPTLVHLDHGLALLSNSHTSRRIEPYGSQRSPLEIAVFGEMEPDDTGPFEQHFTAIP